MLLNRRRLMQLAGLLPAGLLPRATLSQAQDMAFRHGTSLLGAVKYPPGFTHFDYVNPAAPKGGRMRIGLLGTFDSLNGLTIKGDPIDPGVNELLTAPALDEPASDYGLLAEGLWFPDDVSRVIYRLRPQARFHDGQPVSPADVIFSFEAVKANVTTRAAYYKNVLRAEQTGEHDVTFVFDAPGNLELPKILGQLQVVSRAWWTGKDASGKPRDVSGPTLEPLLGSGPYRLADVKPGYSMLLRRVPDYWGKDLPVNVGQFNFDEVEMQFYRDPNVMFEAFKGDQFDIQREATAKTWATGYDFPAVAQGRVVREEIPKKGVNGMQAWVLNLRRAKFADARVRRALNLAFDFEWSNANLFYGQYQRSRSYFNSSELEATGLPSPAELAILEPLRAQLPPEVFTTPYANPINATPQERRNNLRQAQALLAEAGWKSSQQGNSRVLKNAAGEPFTLEFLLYSPAFERIALPYKEQLLLLGFDVSIRLVDLAQYQRQISTFDFDVVVASWPQSLSPGNEQRQFWGSDFANRHSSQNYSGIANPAVDAIVNTLIHAPDRAALVAATRALDRVLMWNHYVVPMWFVPNDKVAYWRRVRHPDVMPGFALGYPTIWWWDAKAAAEIAQ